MNVNRRNFIMTGALASSALLTRAQSTTNQTPELLRRHGRQDLDLVFAFVRAGHNDLEKVKYFVTQDAKLVFAAWDWGGGDWETALGGASHTGHSDIARYLLSQGARIDSFCAAMLGEREVLKALLTSNPSVANTRGPHGFTLLYHSAISGDVDIAEDLKPYLAPNAKDYNQALSAAARDGRLAMTTWLLNNGVTDPNVPDAFNKTPLEIALAKGFKEVAEVLRKSGGKAKT